MNGLSSTGTQLVRDRAYWTRVIHNAAQVSPDDPRYPASRAVAQQALQNLRGGADAAAEKDIQDISPGVLGTSAVKFGHGASAGLAPYLATEGAATAQSFPTARGGPPVAGFGGTGYQIAPPAPSQENLLYQQLAAQANPKAALISDVIGSGALATVASPLVAGTSPAAGGALLGGSLAGIRGAIEPIPGLTRGESAALSGTIGTVTGAVLGKFVGKLTPLIRTVVSNVKRLIGPGVAQADADAITEAAVRSKLAQYNLAPDVLERAIQSWKNSGELSVRAPTAVRPGETLTPTARPAPDPLAAPAFTRGAQPMTIEQVQSRAGILSRVGQVEREAINARMAQRGTGQTLPYYPRGGAAEQALAPAPSSSPPMPLAGNQQQVFANFLQGATPQDLGARIATMRALGVPLPPTAERDLLAALLTGQR